MSRGIKVKKQKVIRILTFFYLIPFVVMVAFNTINSLLRTTYFELYQVMETAKYKWDSPLVVLAASVGIIVCFYLLMRAEWTKNIRIERLALVYSAVVCLLIVLLFRSIVTCDSGSISDIAIEFMQGNYHAFEQGEYLYRYSFQIGFTALLEWIYRIFGVENFIVFQLINIVCIVVILKMLGKITRELFADECVGMVEAVLSMGMLPLFLFSTFVYGDILGWSFGVCSIYYLIRYLKMDRWQNLLKAALLLTLGTIVKSNINILVVAAVIAVILHSFYKKRFKMLIWVIGIVLISQTRTWIVNGVYTARAGLSEFPKGIPKIAWIAMSMQEADEGGYTCGWYNGYNWSVYGDNDFDRELTNKACMESIKDSMNRFVHEQRYALDFFYKKFTSQWNAPTFQAMITNEWNSRHVENLSSVAQFFLYGTGRKVLYEMMNIYHFFLFLCTLVYCFFLRKEWSLEKAYFVLNIFGGFLFHMIWEAQARYVLGYFVLMLPLAAFGLNEILKKIDWIKKGGRT